MARARSCSRRAQAGRPGRVRGRRDGGGFGRCRVLGAQVNVADGQGTFMQAPGVAIPGPTVQHRRRRLDRQAQPLIALVDGRGDVFLALNEPFQLRGVGRTERDAGDAVGPLLHLHRLPAADEYAVDAIQVPHLVHREAAEVGGQVTQRLGCGSP
jgi:hypothetical protein